MAKVWVLDTETKGTGANMVPLEKVLRKSSPPPAQLVVAPRRRAQPEPEPEPKQPHVFRVVDLMTRQPLIEDASVRETVDALKGVRSMVDVNLYVWEPLREDWRLLTLGEKRTIWDLRDS